MSTINDRSNWFSERTGLVVLTVLTVGLATVIVLPYLQYVLFAAVLAYILAPAQRRLEDYVSSMVAALSLIVVAILVIILPVLYVLAVAVQEALELATAIQEGSLDAGTLEERLETVGYTGDVDPSGLYAAYQEPIGTGLQGIATATLEVVGGLPDVLIGLTVTVFVLFALLRDGGRLVAWLGSVAPIRADVQRELFAELDRLMWASVVGNVVVAAIQAVLLGIGLALLGVPAVVLLTVSTFVFALLPLIGAFAVWFPVSIYLLAVGRPLAAGLIFGYGALVSASDGYLRPALIGHSSELNAAIIVVGIFGGLVVFGAVGLFVGPVVLGAGKVVLDLFARERASALAP